MGIPTRSTQRKLSPRSRRKLFVPRTPVASQAEPKNPPHRPSSVETMYQVGGSESLAMAASGVVSPLMAAVMATNSAANTCPPTKPRMAKSNHVQATPRFAGAAPAASWRPRDTSGPLGPLGPLTGALAAVAHGGTDGGGGAHPRKPAPGGG